MLQIRFPLSGTCPDLPPGYELGDMTLHGEFGEASSASRTPNQSMMVILSIVELLDGVRRLLSLPKVKEYRFIGVDSSFSILFRKHNTQIRIFVNDMHIHSSSASDLKADIERSVLEFVSNTNLSQIANRAEVSDFDNALTAFRDYSMN